MPQPSAAAARERVHAAERAPLVDRLIVAAFMLVTIASGFAGAAGYDTTRDVAQALAIREGAAFPLHGPMFAGSLHLGPLWFYVLSLPLFVHTSWLGVALFVPALGSLQFPLAYATGRRLRDRRLGLFWCALLALPGWGSFQLIGFAHTNVVPAMVMLVLYALVRLAQERKPAWLVAALGALSLAVHAHPSALAYAPLVAAVGLYAIRDAGTLVRWSIPALLVALLPFAPLAFDATAASDALLRQSGDYVEASVRAGNLANVPALFYAVLERGPRIVADAFCGVPAAFASIVGVATSLIEVIAVIGICVAVVRRDRLAWIAVALAMFVATVVALLRPTTPFYMTYALLPGLAGAGAVGLHALASRVAMGVALAVVGAALLLHAAVVAGIGSTIASGHVAVPVVSRLDVKQDDPAPMLPEPWLAAYAVDRSGTLLCGTRSPVVLHGTYAFVEDLYLGLDRRLHCAKHDVHLIGVAPGQATHLVGLAMPLWRALGWAPELALGGLGVAPVARAIHPATGFAVPDGSVYPPHAIIAGDARPASVDFSVPASEALVVSQPYAVWMPTPTLTVSANGKSVAPLARDAASAVYVCAECPKDAPVAWRMEIDSVAPERIDVVTIAPTRR